MDRITICRDSKSSSDGTNEIDDDFHGYELLLLRKLQSDPATCMEWREKLLKKIEDDNYDFGEIPHNMWYLVITLDQQKKRFLKFVCSQVSKPRPEKQFVTESLLMRYLNTHMFTELHLDAIFKYGDNNILPKEIFRCPSVRVLSLKYNYLDKIPPDIGRMMNLEKLALTNNKLQNKSIPFSLTFCSKLETLLLDNNNLDALPGFLLRMKSLKTVYRHGNHNYFKSTFMWYHTDVNDRILRVCGIYDFNLLPYCPEKLQFWAARAIIGSKHDFYSDRNIAPRLKDYITDIYPMFNICGFCNTAKLPSQAGFKVITFKNPYLGNTCVPFQHWACSVACATAIEIPARKEQIAAACDLDQKYDSYISECQSEYSSSSSHSSRGLLLRRSSRKPLAGHQGSDCHLSHDKFPDQRFEESEEDSFSFNDHQDHYVTHHQNVPADRTNPHSATINSHRSGLHPNSLFKSSQRHHRYSSQYSHRRSKRSRLLKAEKCVIC